MTAPEQEHMSLEVAMLYVNRHGARLVHSDTYGGEWEGQRCWYVADRRGSRVSLVCGSWIEALYSFRRDPTLPPGERDPTAELIEAVERFLDKHFHGGSKANRPDYVTLVPTEDIYALRAALAKRKERS